MLNTQVPVGRTPSSMSSLLLATQATTLGYKMKTLLVPIMWFLLTAALLALGEKGEDDQRSVTDEAPVHDSSDKEVVHLALASCGPVGIQTEEALTLVKSALITTATHLHVHLFVDAPVQQHFIDVFGQWQQQLTSDLRFYYDLYEPRFPSDGPISAKNWREFYAPCSALRLFIPDLLDNIAERVIYVDSDIIFLQPPEALWEEFRSFNASHVAALVTEHDVPDISWYYVHSKIPHYPDVGLNAGVMLMDLERMRQVDWQHHVMSYFDIYEEDMPWKDQDAVNIFFHFHPDTVLLLPCKWNYRSDHCKYMQTCSSAKQEGVALMHGNRKVFHNEKEAVFKAVYDSFNEYRMDEAREILLRRLNDNLSLASRQNKRSKYHSPSVSKCDENMGMITSWLEMLSTQRDEL